VKLSIWITVEIIGWDKVYYLKEKMGKQEGSSIVKLDLLFIKSLVIHY